MSDTLPPVTLPTGQQLTYGLYPNPYFHRGRPAGVLGFAVMGGSTRNAVLAPDGKVWVEVIGSHGPTGDWLNPMVPVEFTPDSPPCQHVSRAGTRRPATSALGL